MFFSCAGVKTFFKLFLEESKGTADIICAYGYSKTVYLLTSLLCFWENKVNIKILDGREKFAFSCFFMLFSGCFEELGKVIYIDKEICLS